MFDWIKRALQRRRERKAANEIANMFDEAATRGKVVANEPIPFGAWLQQQEDRSAQLKRHQQIEQFEVFPDYPSPEPDPEPISRHSYDAPHAFDQHPVAIEDAPMCAEAPSYDSGSSFDSGSSCSDSSSSDSGSSDGGSSGIE